MFGISSKWVLFHRVRCEKKVESVGSGMEWKVY